MCISNQLSVRCQKVLFLGSNSLSNTFFTSCVWIVRQVLGSSSGKDLLNEIKRVIYTVLKRCYTGSCPVTTLKTISYSKYKLSMNLSDVKRYLSYESYDSYKYMKVIDIRRLKVSQVKELF